MEVAAALTDKAHSVSVIGIETVPFKKALGEKVGKAIMKVNTNTDYEAPHLEEKTNTNNMLWSQYHSNFYAFVNEQSHAYVFSWFHDVPNLFCSAAVWGK